MRRLSKSISQLSLSYDVVVIGSGYGGGVAASRLARCGRRVCLLERGKEYEVGEFPDRLLEAQSEFQYTRNNTHLGSKLGLYDMRVGDDIDVFIGCGLGGTSLINANVSLPPDPRVWEDPIWPQELAQDAEREEGFERAKRMLKPVPYPNEKPLNKLEALGKSAVALDGHFSRPPINVTFEEGFNHAGVFQPSCTLCGDCCSGCNVGAKNTVQMTYLPDAVNHGAEIFTECDVSSLRKEGDKWRIFFEFVGLERDKFDSPEQSITADIVVLAAGTLGSTEILLRSQTKNGLKLSKRLGQGFTGNGDVLAFGYNTDQPINGIGFGHPPKVDIPPVGPCISGLIDLRNTDTLEQGIVIEEGTIPSALAPLLPALMSVGGLLGDDTDFSISDEAGEKARALRSLFFGAYRGAVNHTQTYLVMSHDDAGGSMRLNGDKLVIDWPGVADQSVFDRVGINLTTATAANGGTYVKNPLSSTLFGKNMITVHPLGGCGIGHDRIKGVVNHKCQVFSGETTESINAVHKGLYVCDGAVIPRPLGVNPLLTISGLAERAMIHIAQDYGWAFDDKPKPDAPRRYATITAEEDANPAGIEFTERMSGFISQTVTSDYAAAARAGQDEKNTFSFTATILIEDIDTFIRDNAHTGRIVGSVSCPSLSSEPLDISRGVFNLLHVDPSRPETRRLDYRFVMSTRDGQEYLFEGHKIVHSDHGLEIWEDTTKLFVQIHGGRDGHDGLIAKGILHISLLDFAREMRTMKGINGRNALDRMEAVTRFGTLFAGSLFKVYGGVFVPTDRYDRFHERKKRTLRVGPPELHGFKTRDGKALRLTRYNGGAKGPVILSHGLGVSSLIFSIDTIETNLLEYLYAAGYDCWLFDYRASTELPYSSEMWTADDVAMLDYPPAVAKVKEITGRNSVQMVVHCFGSTTFFMSMLVGLGGVRSAVSSQIATDVLVPFWPQRFLAQLRMPTLFNVMGINAVNARAERYDSFGARALDKIIQVVVPFQKEERTRNATSNRITALYGQLYELSNLNQATLRSGLPEMFGNANIDAFKHLAVIARRKIIVDHNGDDTYLPHIARLKLPIRFIHGAENACFHPQSTKRTLDRLVAANGTDLYDRRVIPGYGHIDCIFGKTAAADVYPFILQHLEKTARS